MHLVQLLVPLYDEGYRPVDQRDLQRVESELVTRFGGVAAFRRTPTDGRWQNGGGSPLRNELVIFEVMTEVLDRVWWAGYRGRLTERFHQAQLVVRALAIECL